MAGAVAGLLRFIRPVSWILFTGGVKTRRSTGPGYCFAAEHSGRGATCSQPAGEMIVRKRFTDMKTLGRVTPQLV